MPARAVNTEKNTGNVFISHTTRGANDNDAALVQHVTKLQAAAEQQLSTYKILTQMLQQRLAELEQLAMFNKEPKDITKKVSKMKQRLEAELAAVPDAQLRAKADARLSSRASS
jgi:hypothetical protein